MGERVEIPERIAIWGAISPSTLHGRTLVHDETATTTALSCPILVHLAATCFPKNAHPRPHSRPQRLLGEPSPEHVSRISPRKKRPPQTRRALLTQSRNLLRSPTAYSPNAFFSALTRLRLTGIFSSTPFSVSSNVPPETDSISSTMERFTRYPRCTRKNPWPSKRFSS